MLSPNPCAMRERRVKEERGKREEKRRQGGNQLKHVPCNRHNPTKRRLPHHGGRLLQPRLDRVDRRVGQRAHGARHQADDGRLVGW